MADDRPHRLREPWHKWPDSPPPAICLEAADEIDRLRAHVAELTDRCGDEQTANEIDRLRAHVARVRALRAQVAALEAENRMLQAERKALFDAKRHAQIARDAARAEADALRANEHRWCAVLAYAKAPHLTPATALAYIHRDASIALDAVHGAIRARNALEDTNGR